MSQTNALISRAYVNTASGQVHLRRAAPGAAPALVMLHQTASSSVMYEPLMGLLAGDFDCIALDTPGYGGSPALAGRPSAEAYAATLRQALAGLGIARCTLLGHHTGAAIAIRMMTDDPALAEGAILIGPPLLSEAQKTALSARLKAPQLAEDGSHLLALWERIKGRMPADAPLELVQRETLLTLGAGEQAPLSYAAVFDMDMPALLRRIPCPVLCLAGEFDTLRESLEPAAGLIKGARVAVVPGAGTYLCDTHPEEVAARVRDFLKKGENAYE